MADLGQLLGIGAGGITLGALGTGLLISIVAIMIWKLIWYGIALYNTIQRKQIKWFVVLFVAAFVLNDLGILAIIYLMIYRDKAPIEKAVTKKKRR
ncbi:MAG: hypothetical protein KKE50_00405 [Nanoarchaeota archaeon]|nr:hypothetical protein [Nanoarchaeota archaeon]